jgi:hypothetical protein
VAVFFALSSLALGIIIFVIVLGSTVIGLVVGRWLRRHKEALREPFGVLQAALLGVVGLTLAFGLSLAVGRYEDRRAALVDEANAIGTTYLRAQTLAEPMRSQSLDLLVQYTDVEIRLAKTRPDSHTQRTIIASGGLLQRQLWAVADQSLQKAPAATAPRLYVESLNDMIDSQTTRVASLGNRVPTEVLLLEVVGAATALALLGLYLAVLGRGVLTVMVAAVFVTLLLLVTFDLDRPTRGLISIPATPLVQLRVSMQLPPAAGG